VTGLHRRLTHWALGAALVVVSACGGGTPQPTPNDVPPITLPPPLVGRSVASDVPATIDSTRWRLTPDGEVGGHAPWLRVFYGQDLRGELEACGCPGAPTGGFSRRATVLAQIRESLRGSRLVEGPNALTRSLNAMESFDAQERARARLILSILGDLGVEAFFPGQADLQVLPPSELAEAAASSGLPVVATNLAPSVTPPGWRTGLVWEIDGKKVLVVGLVGAPRTDEQTRLSPTVAPSVALASLRNEVGPVDVVVGFTSADERERRAWDEQGLDLDVLLVPFEREEQVAERWRGSRYEVTADPLGRALRRLDLVMTGREPGLMRQPDGEVAPRALASQEETWLRLARARRALTEAVARGEDPRQKVRGYDGQVRVDPSTDPDAVQRDMASLVPERDASLRRAAPASTAHHVAVAAVVVLPPEVPGDPDVERVIDEYQAKWLADLEALVATSRDSGEDARRYGGVDTCVGCHQAEYAQWGRTAHVGAYKTLRERAEHRNPDCLACHATGFGKPGGFADPSETLALLNVQCEACHGPMARHAREAGTGSGTLAPSPGQRISEGTCTACHDPANSPQFDYEAYRPQVAHGRSRAQGGTP
jgi:hypothetical protein